MNDHHRTPLRTTDLQRAGAWLDGEVRLSRKILVAGGLLVLVLLGIALD